jgi:RNA polymerase sigma-70 factor (ECF subfamily)
MIQHTSDEVLVEQTTNGCMDSFEQLVARYQVPLVQFIAQRIGSFEDAEDLTQDTMVRAYQHLHRYRADWRFSTWLFTIARRLCINHQRHCRALCRDRSREEPDALSQVVDPASEPGAVVAEQEYQQRLWALAASVLSEAKFTTLWLFYVEEMPVAEIAQVVGRSRVAVKTMMFRARKELSPYFEKALAEAERPVQHEHLPDAQGNMYDRLADRLLVTRRLVTETAGV